MGYVSVQVALLLLILLTRGISPIRIEVSEQFHGWYSYIGGEEKGLQI